LQSTSAKWLRRSVFARSKQRPQESQLERQLLPRKGLLKTISHNWMFQSFKSLKLPTSSPSWEMCMFKSALLKRLQRTCLSRQLKKSQSLKSPLRSQLSQPSPSLQLNLSHNLKLRQRPSSVLPRPNLMGLPLNPMTICRRQKWSHHVILRATLPWPTSSLLP